jgi:hypothetical protein
MEGDAPEMDWKLVIDLVEKYGSTRFINEQLPKWRRDRRNPVTKAPEPWTQVDLSKAMIDAGFLGMNKSVIWKIENPDKPSGGRPVTLDEAITLARLFGKSLPEVLLPPHALAEVDGWKHFMQAADALNDVRYAWARYEDEVARVRNAIAARPELRKRIEEHRTWAAEHFQEQVRETWENDEQGTGVSLAQYTKGFTPTPAMLASEDVLSARDLPDQPWLVREK